MRAPLHVVVVSAFVAILAGACGGARTIDAPRDVARENATIDARLRGTWRLERFQPVQPLGPTLDALLAFQVQNMVIRLDGRRLVADSPGVHVDRAYEVRDANGDRFKVVVVDEQGVPVVSECNFVADGVVEANVESDPWRGVATLRKTGL